MKRTLRLPDATYVEGLQQQKAALEEQFYNVCHQYFMGMYNSLFTVRRMRDDIFQESFITLWMEITSHTISVVDGRVCRRGTDNLLHEMTCSLTTFLISIARHKYGEWMRGDNLTLTDDMEGETIAAVQIGNGITQEEETKQRIVESCVMNLPQRCKEILTLFYYEQLSLDEILERRQENVSKDGLKTGKHKCMTQLKNAARTEFDRYHIKPYLHCSNGPTTP